MENNELKELNSDIELHEKYMRLAIEEAELARAEDEVPIGAVIVRGGKVIAAAHNKREGSKCATHHAEILTIEAACQALGGWRLPDTTLYVTLEPCAMCAGAIINARIPNVVFGAYDLRFGAMGSLVDLTKAAFNHIPTVTSNILGDECRALLSDYFKMKREKK